MFYTDLQHTNVVLFHHLNLDDGEADTNELNVFKIITKAHLQLAKTNCVLALGYTIKLL